MENDAVAIELPHPSSIVGNTSHSFSESSHHKSHCLKLKPCVTIYPVWNPNPQTKPRDTIPITQHASAHQQSYSHTACLMKVDSELQ